MESLVENMKCILGFFLSVFLFCGSLIAFDKHPSETIGVFIAIPVLVILFDYFNKRRRSMENIVEIKKWGLGVSVDEKGEFICYGCPVVEDPTRFSPDYEVCTAEEIENHKRSLRERNEKL